MRETQLSQLPQREVHLPQASGCDDPKPMGIVFGSHLWDPALSTFAHSSSGLLITCQMQLCLQGHGVSELIAFAILPRETPLSWL